MSDAAPSKNSLRLARVLAAHRVTHVLDVGANIGQYARRLRRAGYDREIISFEPIAEIHARLAAAARADAAWRVWPEPLALGDADGKAVLNLSARSDMSSVLDFTQEMAAALDDAAFTGRRQVPQRRLDGLLAGALPTEARPFLKIDTQGYEEPVLAGATGLLPRLAGLQVELSIVPVYRQVRPWREMIDWIGHLGFTPVLFIPGYFHRRTARQVEMDAVFVPHDAAAAGPGR